MILPLGCNGPASTESGDTETGDGDGDPAGDGDGDPTGDGDGDPGCTPGTFGCDCDNGSCDAGLMCVNGECELGDDPPCVPGTLDCECSNGACSDGFECIDDVCSYPPSPHPNCGWNADDEWYACGFDTVDPQTPISCGGAMLESGVACPPGLTVVGCCDEFGNNWWCEGGEVEFQSCGGPGDGDGDPGDGDGDPGDGDGDPGDGDGDPGDGDGDPTGDGDGDP